MAQAGNTIAHCIAYCIAYCIDYCRAYCLLHCLLHCLLPIALPIVYCIAWSDQSQVNQAGPAQGLVSPPRGIRSHRICRDETRNHG